MAGWFTLPLLLLGIAAYFQVYQVDAAIQRLTVYQYRNGTGDGIILTGKYPNITNLFDFIYLYGGSFCAVGKWDFFEASHYGLDPWFHYLAGDVEEICEDFLLFDVHNIKSLRHLGPSDFSKPAIAFYEGSRSPGGSWHDRAGKEYVVTDLAGNALNFVPETAILFGNESWTLFSGNLFEGESFCFGQTDTGVMTAKIHVAAIPFRPRSVVRGCDYTEVQANIQLFKHRII